MLLAVDVQYRDPLGFVAAVGFESWISEKPSATFLHTQQGVEAYVPGQFYMRELPCILALLKLVPWKPECIIIDGFVFLDGHTKPGLGMHLYEALHREIEIIGVAKTSYAKSGDECKVFRGGSSKPLYITCAGGTLESAKSRVLNMHGPNRIPVILKTTDQICREAAKEA